MSNQQQQSSPGRLPSFKGPRDLSLLTTATSSLSLTSSSSQSTSASSSQNMATRVLVPRPKRVFKPNIPPKRDKDGGSETSTALVASSSTSSDMAGPSQQNRGGGGRGEQGGRGRGRGRGRGGNLIQSSSVFAEGIGDPLSSRTRSSRGRGRGGVGGGGGRGRGGGSRKPGGGGSNRSASIKDIIKNEVDGSESADANGGLKQEISEVLESGDDQDYFGGAGDDDETPRFEPENEAVVLPLTNYLPKLRIKKKPPKFQPGASSQSLSYQIEDYGCSPEDFLSVAGKSRFKPVLTLFQLPSHLPVLLEEQEQRALATSLDTLPEGRIGKMQFLADGRCRFVLENSIDGEKNVFDVGGGKPIGFRQDLVSIDLENGKLVELGAVKHKFVITPDIETLLLNMR